MPLWNVRVLVEYDDTAEVERLAERIEALVCPHPAMTDHRCPRRWLIISSQLDDEDAAAYDDLLND